MRRKNVLRVAACFLVLATIADARAFAQEARGSDETFMSHITVAAPFFTHHFPKDGDFNDHNWGGVIFYALGPDISLAAGDFSNSYRRNTAFAGVSFTPWNLDLSAVQLSPGALVGVDLSGGYRGFDPMDPLLAAATIKISTAPFFDPHFQFLNRVGLLVTIIPGLGSHRSTASNLALTIRL